MKELKSFTVKSYIIMLFFVIPFFYDNAYFNMIEAKANIVFLVLFWLVGISFVLLFIELMYRVFTKEDYKIHNRIFDKRNYSSLDWTILFFMIVIILSFLLSDIKNDALFGNEGWKMGSAIMVLFCLSYFFISRNIEIDKFVYVLFFISTSLTFILAILNSLEIDPFGFHKRMYDKDIHRYLAIIGNINTYAGYLSMIVPIIIGYIIMKDKIDNNINKRLIYIFLFTLSILAYCNVIICNSDGAYLGLLFGILVLVFCLIGDYKKLRLLFINGLLFSVSAMIIKIITLIDKAKIYFLEGISAQIIYKNIWIYVFGFCSAIIIFLSLLIYKNYSCNIKKIRSIYIFIIVVFLLVGIYIFANEFSDVWGNNRGKIWKYSLKVFWEATIKHKFFGYGSDCFGVIIMDKYKTEIIKIWNMPVVNAHNEWLQYLVTNGIFGVVSYASIWICLVVNMIKRFFSKTNIESKKDKMSVVLFASVAGYMGQALVNNPHALNVVYLFFIFAVYRKINDNCCSN